MNDYYPDHEPRGCWPAFAISAGLWLVIGFVVLLILRACRLA